MPLKIFWTNLKDHIPPEKKIRYLSYQLHIGKTKRDFETRVKEHFRNIYNRETEKTPVAVHAWKEKHIMDRKPVLLKQASNN
jgi:hypothetical protein